MRSPLHCALTIPVWGDIYVCSSSSSSSSTMYQQHSNVKILEWQQQQQQCFLCNEKQLLNGTELWIQSHFHHNVPFVTAVGNILIESIITLISFQLHLLHYCIGEKKKYNNYITGRYFVMSPKEACGKKNLVFEKTLMLRSF